MNTKNNNKTLYDGKISGIAYSALILLFVFLSLLIGFILNLFNLTSGVLYNAITAIVPIIALSLVIIGISKYTKTPIKETVSLKKFSPVYLIPTLMIAVGMLLGAGFLNGLFSKLLQDLGVKLPESSLTISSTGEFILFTILVGVLPAVFEESFFRGLMLNGLKNVKTILSLFIIGLCFSVYHASLTQLIYQFIYGAVLGYLAIKSLSTIPAIIAHFINNVTVLVLTYFFNITETIMEPYLIVIGALLLVGGIVFLALYKKDKSEKIVVKGQATKVFLFASAGLIVSLLVAIMGVV